MITPQCNAITRRYTPYAVDEKAPVKASVEAAAAGHKALSLLYPTQQATLDTAWKAGD